MLLLLLLLFLGIAWAKPLKTGLFRVGVGAGEGLTVDARVCGMACPNPEKLGIVVVAVVVVEVAAVNGCCNTIDSSLSTPFTASVV